jgi:hypothetical protein
MSIYGDWGFKQNPFEQTPLGPDRTGETLLVGRKTELAELKAQIENPPKLPTVEGLNGVGKTSLVNVAGFQLFQNFVKTGKGPLFVPCNRSFQLTRESTAQNFVESIWYGVAQTIIELKTLLEREGANLRNLPEIDKWLNSPIYENVQAGATAFGFGGSGGHGSVPAGKGFEKEGFARSVKEWLRCVFPNRKDGGIICIIDNLELLLQAEATRQVLEEIRDSLLTVPGIRCVLCAANGIIYSVVSSPRLAGLLHAPIELKGIAKDAARDVLDSRIRTYAYVFGRAYLPITLAGFEELYRLLNSNLRSALSEADDYCMWAARFKPESNEKKDGMLHDYLLEQGKKVHAVTGTQVARRAWKVFDHAITIGGSFAPGDFASFGFNSAEAFRPSVKELEDVHLVDSVRDDTDQRRKSIVVTPKGYLVSNYRTQTGLATIPSQGKAITEEPRTLE